MQVDSIGVQAEKQRRKPERRSSGACGEIYSVLGVPTFQNRIFHTCADARSCDKGDVNLVRDPTTGFIHNRSFRAELMNYDADYQNEQAVSAVFREHLNAVAAIVEEHFGGLALIEVGCGKGHFLELLQRRGFEVTGLDPTYEGSNPSVIRENFSPELGIRADGLVLRHVLEHVQDPIDFLLRIREANGGGGKIYIEVPCFDWICAKRAWFDIFYEHVNYFRIADFHRIFGRVDAAAHLFGGQYLSVVADLKSLRKNVAARPDEFEFPADFLDGMDTHARSLKSKETHYAAVWGAGAKGAMFALFMERAGAKIDLVVDANPAKHGKYLPGTGLEIHSPEEAQRLLPRAAQVLVMNANYLEEIKAYTGNRFKYVSVEHEAI
jgi:SAM-dependent methyltransferase